MDGKLVTSRKPDDLPVFNQAIFKTLVQPVSVAQR
jgi:putative intracellular protease/amidase